MTRLAQKTKILVSTVSRIGNNWEEKSESFQETPIEYRNDSEPSGEEDPFVKWPEKSRESNPRFYVEKTFTVYIVFNKQNDRVVTFRNDVSEIRWVSTTNHPAELVMLGVVAFSLVWTWLQANLYRLQRSFWDKSYFMGQEIH